LRIRFVPVISASTKSIIRFTFAECIFVVFSVGGQFIPIAANGGTIPWNLLPVGVGFAVAYKLSENNLIVAYFVNLPNAFVTYMLKFEQFPVMELSSTIASIITLLAIIVIYIVLKACTKI